MLTNLVDILIHCVWHIKVNHQSDIDQVQPSAQNTCTDHYLKVTIQKTLKRKPQLEVCMYHIQHTLIMNCIYWQACFY